MTSDDDDKLRTDLCRGIEQLDQQAIEYARANVNNFIELVGRHTDQTSANGVLVSLCQHTVHLDFQAAMDRSNWLLYKGFPGLGKTTQVALRLLWKLGRDKMRRHLFCSHHVQKGDPALKLSKLMMSYMETPLVRAIFPDLIPGRTWSPRGWEVKRPPPNDEPTVRTKQLFGQVTGSRPNVIVLDDIFNGKVVRSEADARRVLDWVDTLFARFGVNTVVEVVWLTNHWHDRDPAVLLEEREREYVLNGEDSLWEIMDVPLIDVRTDENLFPDLVPDERIPVLRRQAGSKWSQLYMHSTQEEDERAFKLEVLSHAFCDDADEVTVVDHEDRHAAEAFAHRFVVLGSIDPAGGTKRRPGKGDRCAIGVHLGSLTSDLQRLLWIESGRIPVEDAANLVLQHNVAYNVDHWVLEDNGVQGWFTAIVDLQYDLAQARAALEGIPFLYRRPVFVTHHTGANKHDPHVGVRSLASEFAAGRHKIPSTSRHRECLDALVRLRDGFYGFSEEAHSADEVMAYWFAATRIRLLQTQARARARAQVQAQSQTGVRRLSISRAPRSGTRVLPPNPFGARGIG